MTTEVGHTDMPEEASDKVLTLPNVITFVRLCMAPLAFLVLVGGNDILATVLFAVSASTDFLDGQIARRTHSVSKIGQLLDPAVDRLLMICGVVGLLIVGRLPAWVVVLVVARDAFLLVAGSHLLEKYRLRIPVIYAGKFATTFLFIGLAGLMLNVPQIAGLGVCDFAWLPGFNQNTCSWGIWCVYIGLCLGAVTTIYYVVEAYGQWKAACGAVDGE